jgi:hypothetical protein
MEAHLGTEKTALVKNLLLQGESINDLVKRIQDEWGLMTDKKPATVQTMLYRFSRGIVKKETVRRVIDTVTASKHVRVTTLTELAGLCEKQKKRLEKALTMESKGPMLLSMVSNEFRLMKDMLRDLALLQIETGILPRAPKTIAGMISDPSTGKVTNFAWMEGDESLLDALRSEARLSFDNAFEGEAVEVEVENDDGPAD